VETGDHCEQLGIRVYRNQHTIILHRERVNDISNDDAIRLFESFTGDLEHSYGGFESKRVGIQAVRWEDSDPWIDSIFVMPTENRQS
jgi:hypothetical protein